MTKIPNKTILLISNDITITENLNIFFNGCNIINFSHEPNIQKNNFDITLLDDFKINNTLLKYIISNSIVINISKQNIDRAINISRPFSLRNLFAIIQDFLSKEAKILKFKNFEIYNDSLRIKNKEITLGNKESLVIEFLYKNESSSKEEILKNIWGYNNILETRVLENTINKIRNRFKDLNINNFIIFENGKYRLNKIYI